jgi:hypothetical protein
MITFLPVLFISSFPIYASPPLYRNLCLLNSLSLDPSSGAEGPFSGAKDPSSGAKDHSSGARFSSVAEDPSSGAKDPSS